MNKLRFKLVFSKRLGMLVPIAEIARSHQKAVTTPGHAAVVDVVVHLQTYWKISRATATLLLAGCLTWMSSPVLALDANALPDTPKIVSGGATFNTDGNVMNINTQSNSAIIRWNSFNIGSNATVNFNMPSASSSVFNRVTGNSASIINGVLKSNGHVYLANQNGIFFGAGAQVNVGSLTATTLDNLLNNTIENIYQNGILSNQTAPVFSFADAVGVIEVAKGASITSANGGRVMLLAPDVTNSGVINTPDGQTILAAGKTVYLSTLDQFAGLLVEVQSGGNAINLGEINVGHGNASLIGLAVNQQGLISASTSVRANGSIYLKAKQIQSLTTPGNDVYGKVTLGAGSKTAITIDTQDKEEVFDSQKIASSVVDIQGKNIAIDGTIVANSGQVNVTARDNQTNNGSVFIGKDALIDVSGVDATAPMSRNQLKIQLFSDQLRDSPVLRGGNLFSQFLYLDARKGTNLLSQKVIDEAKAGISRTIAERSTAGGQVNITAVNLVSKAGSTIDLSAGTINYESGLLRESSLLINGKWVLASDAAPKINYEGINSNDYYSIQSKHSNQTKSWALTANGLNGVSANATALSDVGYQQAAYQQGGNAGAVNIAASNLALQGDVLAQTISGQYQRGENSDHSSALGGLFKLTYNNAGKLNFVSSSQALADDFDENSQLSAEQKQTSEINTAMLANGVSRVEVKATGQVNLNTALQLKENGSLNIQGSGGVNVNQNIRIPTGTVTLASGQNADVLVANNVKIDVSGLFTNDIPGTQGAMNGMIALNGGNITVNNGLRMGQGASMNASSGLWVYALKNVRQAKSGTGGNITVTLADNQVTDGMFSSYGMFIQGQQTLGGHLTLNLQADQGTGLVEHIQLGGFNPQKNNTLWLSENFFKQGGFSQFSLSNADRWYGDVLIGDSANSVVNIAPEQHSRVLTSAASVAENGSDMDGLVSKTALSGRMPSPTSIEVSAGDQLTMQSNASIVTVAPNSQTGARGNVSLTSKGQMTILGDITAPGADIHLAIEDIPDHGDKQRPNYSFDPTLSLYLGETASLIARGQYITPPTTDGNLRSAFVTNAGNISLSAGNGVLIAKEGSLIDASATSGNVDLRVFGGYSRQSVAGKAGSIALSGRDGLALDGKLIANASGAAEGGTLKIALGGKNASGTEGDQNNPLLFTNGSRHLAVTTQKQLQAANNTAGGNNSNLINTSNSSTLPLTTAQGKGQISSEQIVEGGFHNVALTVDNVSGVTGDTIYFDNASLSVPSLLTLDATSISGSANVTASTLVLANKSAVTLPTTQLTAGNDTFKAQANFIEIQGPVAFNNVKETSLQSKSDIRGRGLAEALKGAASLSAPSLIKFDAAQIYPATGVNFTVTATGAGSKIEVTNQANTSSAVPLSAVGSLTLNAENITQAGVLRAPLGQISLNATQSLTLAQGSLTSVSAEGSLIPYAVTVLGGSNLAESKGATTNFMTAIDQKKITLNANNMNVQAGSRIDVSGGGDTLAYEWIQGLGGSLDILSQSGYYAVLPKLGNQYAPYDYLMGSNASAGIGQAIYLAGGNGLAAGQYTLLPALYALLPGAFLISENGANIQLNAQLTQTDGSGLSSGYLTKLDGTSRGQYTSFDVVDGNTFYKDVGTKTYKGLAEYLISSGNAMLTKTALRDGRVVPRLTNDSGQLVIAAGSSLNLEGTINTTSANGGKGALVDISSNDIRVVSTVDPQQTGVLQIAAKQLSNIKADSILLGGTRTVSGQTQTITTTANNVRFSNDASNAVEADELIVASKDTITLSQGAVVKTGVKQDKIGSTSLVTSGNGALLAVSDKNDFDFSRTGVTATPSTGKLVIENGASVLAARSMVLDATNSFNQSGTVNVEDGGSVTLGSNQYSIGDNVVPGATRISTATLGEFGRLSAMTFNSYKNIDIYGAVNFGNSGLNITFNTAGIAKRDAGDVNITANTFTLKNTNNAVFTAATSRNGQLNVNANQIAFADSGTQSNNIGGFNTVALNANKDVRFTGAGTLNVNANQTTVNSAVVTADTGSKYTFANTGTVQTQSNGQAAGDTSGLGATLNLSATSMQLGGQVVLKSGQLNATATTGDIKVLAGGSVDVSSATVVFDAKNTATTDAGGISLTAQQGNVQLDSDNQKTSLLNLSGGETKGNAGKLQVSAIKGRFIANDKTVQAQAASGQKTGSVQLDVASLDNFSQVNQALETGKFNESRDIRVRGGDVTIASGDTVTAHNFTLGVDNGNATVAGRIYADGNKGGDVAIYAKGLVSLTNTAQITARGKQVNQNAGDAQTGSGGTVLLSSDSLMANAVSAQAGALIDVSGYDKASNGNVGVDGADGSVTLRGRRGTSGTANTVNVAVNATSAIKGASEVVVEGSRTYTTTAFTAANMAGMITDTNSFYNANPSNSGYAATQDGIAAKVLPHIEVRSTTGSTATAMTVGATATDINLRSFGSLLAGRGGSLTLRANGNLTFNGSLSDGFSTATTAGVLATAPATTSTGDLRNDTNTFNFNLISGADYNAANMNETVAGVGDFTLATAKLIRTGDGNINIAAGNNMSLSGNSSAIYTVGKQTSNLSGFTPPTTIVPTTTNPTVLPSNAATTNAPTTASYVNNGGDIAINVKGNISAVATTQSVNQWLLRQAVVNSDNSTSTSWWVRPDLFQQGVAALGGGDVSVQAGGNISNLSASSATNAQYLKTYVTDKDGKVNEVRTSLVNGGGDVSVTAGGNITNGVYYVGRGQLTLEAGDSILKTGTTGTVIALQDATADVRAKNNLRIETAFNPTLWVQGAALSSNQISNSTFFNTYSDKAALNVTSLAGNVEVGLSRANTIASAGLSTGHATAINNDMAAIHPGTVNVTAFDGDITAYKMVLAPSSSGNLSLLAAGSVTGGATTAGTINPTAHVIISDADLSAVLNVFNPFVGDPSQNSSIIGVIKTGNSPVPVHKNDTIAAVILARDGNVTLTGTPTASSTSNIYGIKSSKPIYVRAGNNVTMHASIQHNNVGDVSEIYAGNDFVMENGKQMARIDVNGPGEVLIKAGRNIDLGNTSGILSLANTVNPNLASNSANLTLMAGMGKSGTNVDDFVRTYIDPTGTGPASFNGDAAKLADYRKATASRVQAYMNEISGSNNPATAKPYTSDEALVAFLKLDATKQEIFALREFNVELRAAYAITEDLTIAADKRRNLALERSDKAIATLFSGKDYSGDILMYQSQIRTSRDGNINLFVPGGLVNAGVASNATLQHDIGIVTEKGGDIKSYSHGNFMVNQSKVITQYGSDIQIWSNYGNIDAGRGSKSVQSAPERVISVNANGDVTVEMKGVASGSGIRAQTYDPDGSGPAIAPKEGRAILAPVRGTLDAGEAGIAAGSFGFFGNNILNGSNISVSGSSSGVPVSDSGSLAGAAGNATNTSAGASNGLSENLAAKSSQAALPRELPPIVTVKTIRLED